MHVLKKKREIQVFSKLPTLGIMTELQLLKQGATLTEVKEILIKGCATGDARLVRVVLDNRKRELQQINQEEYLLHGACIWI